MRVLQRFEPMRNLYVSPNIPKDLLYAATSSLQVSDSILGLIDGTALLGLVNETILIGCEGVYWKKGSTRVSMLYATFRRRIFEPINDYVLGVGFGEQMGIRGIPAAAMAAILKAINEELKKPTQSGVNLTGLSAVAGMFELKKLLREEIVEVFRNREKYLRYGLSLPNGVLLFGPPGCGKTYIARQLAAELKYNFVEVAPSDIGSMYVHGTTLNIRDTFEKAAEKAPSIVFIDEFEAMVPDRSELSGIQQHKAEEVNEFLAQMNSCSERGILLIAATNAPWNIDPAVQRSGRLDKKVYVGSPDYEARKEILLLHLRGRFATSDITVDDVAQNLSGYSCSDLKLLVDEAAKMALIADQPISSEHLHAATKKVPPSMCPEDEERYRSFGTRG